MRLSREKTVRLSHRVLDFLVGSPDVDFVEEKLGSIEPGKLADLAVLSADYLTIPDDAIRNLKCTLTMVDGTIVYQA